MAPPTAPEKPMVWLLLNIELLMMSEPAGPIEDQNIVPDVKL